jgi:hypothetical protein
VPKRGLTESWIAAAASLPTDWRLMGVALGPREVDPRIGSELWVAWARGPDGERIDGQGKSPEEALDALTSAKRKSAKASKAPKAD